MITSRGFDLANYFWEFCNDYESETLHIPNDAAFPSEEFILQVIEEYLRVVGDDYSTSVSVLHEIKTYLPLVHLHWALWGLIKAVEPSISDFDYQNFSWERAKRISI